MKPSRGVSCFFARIFVSAAVVRLSQEAPKRGARLMMLSYEAADLVVQAGLMGQPAAPGRMELSQAQRGGDDFGAPEETGLHLLRRFLAAHDQNTLPEAEREERFAAIMQQGGLEQGPPFIGRQSRAPVVDYGGNFERVPPFGGRLAQEKRVGGCGEEMARAA